MKQQPMKKWCLAGVLAVCLLIILVSTVTVDVGHAQSCNYATIIDESVLHLDLNAICDAAQPLSQEGYDVLIYLTDYEPVNESDWYNHLDQVEVNAGLLQSVGVDSFKPIFRRVM